MEMLRLDHTYSDRELRPLLGSLLVKKGMITPAQLDAALSERARTGERLGQVLLRQGSVFEDELARTLAEQLGMTSISIATVSVDPFAVALIQPELGARLGVLPVRLLPDETVLVAVADPTDEEGLDEVRAALGRPVKFVIGLPSEIDALWRRFGL